MKFSPYEGAARALWCRPRKSACVAGLPGRATSHMRLTTTEHGEHHLTIPSHDPLRVGTLSAILADIAEHFGMTREELMTRLFGR